jgi:hypothetical protein
MAGRQLRGVGGEEAAKAFVKAGGIRRAGKGDHVNIKMPMDNSLRYLYIES